MLAGDLPFLKKFLGLTEHWYIPSVHNLGLWNPLKRRYLGCYRRRTRTGDASRLGKTPVCKGARGCASKPLLQVPRHHAIICVLHMLLRIGALLGEYLDRVCLSASREARNAINNMLKIALCGWQLGGTCRPDGQETKRLFFIWDGIAHVLGLADEHLGNQAVMRLRDVMQRLYRTYQRIGIDLPADCRQAAWEFRAHCLPDTRSHYLKILEFDVESWREDRTVMLRFPSSEPPGWGKCTSTGRLKGVKVTAQARGGGEAAQTDEGAQQAGGVQQLQSTTPAKWQTVLQAAVAAGVQHGYIGGDITEWEVPHLPCS